MVYESVSVDFGVGTLNMDTYEYHIAPGSTSTLKDLERCNAKTLTNGQRCKL